jgi:hypothetical protein
MVLTTPAAFADDQADRTATVTGVLFDDQNLNGVREAGEPGLPGLKVHGAKDVVTDAEGRYTITGVLHDETEDLWLPTAANGGKLTLSKPTDAAANGVAWISGWVYVKVGGDPVTTHDFGYGRWGANQTVSLHIQGNKRSMTVGEKLRLTAYTTTRAAPGYGGVRINVPDGMHLAHQELNPSTAYEWTGTRHLVMYRVRTQEPWSTTTYLVDMVADKPLPIAEVNATLAHDEGTDTEVNDDVSAVEMVVKAKPAKQVDQVVAPKHSSGTGTGTPQASPSKELAYTGVEPKPYLAAGVALLGVGVALVGVARRRPRLTEANKS